MTNINTRALRNAGGLYFLLVVTSIFGFFTPQALVVPGDAAATASKILASETLFRFALVSGLISSIGFVFLVLELYKLLSHVNRWQAVAMVVLVLLSIPLSFVTTLNDVAVLTVLHGGPALSGFATSQIDALVMLFLKLDGNLTASNSIFFGLWLFPFGLLVVRSGFIPRILGYLLLIAGLAYLVGSLNFLLAPPSASAISGILTIGYVGELGIVGWLAFQAARIQFRRQSARQTGDVTLPQS